MNANPLDTTLADLEALQSREQIRQRVTDMERAAALTHSGEVQRFLRYIVRPCLAGSSNPVFAAEFTAHADRFTRLWKQAR